MTNVCSTFRARRGFAGVLLASPFAARAERIKDLATIAGVRGNQLIGYGLVVGLDGTGDQTSQTPFTIQSIKNMLAQLGVLVPDNVNPQLRNVAAVTVQATLPPFAKPGQTLDITVSSIGNAQSLRGGSLLMTPLRGADGEIYALAQGNLDRRRIRRAGRRRPASNRQRAEHRPCAERRDGRAHGADDARYDRVACCAELEFFGLHDGCAAHGIDQCVARRGHRPSRSMPSRSVYARRPARVRARGLFVAHSRISRWSRRRAARARSSLTRAPEPWSSAPTVRGVAGRGRARLAGRPASRKRRS